MEIRFKEITFAVGENGAMGLREMFGIRQDLEKKKIECFALPEVDIAGGNTSGRFATSASALTKSLRYISHSINDDFLDNQTKKRCIQSHLDIYADNELCVRCTIENI